MSLVWRIAFGILPVPIVYTDELPEGVGGETRGPLIRIRPKYRERGDEGLHQHELTHVRQFWALWAIGAVLNAPAAWWIAVAAGSPLVPMQAALWAALACAVLHPLLYRFSRAYRLWAEASAYAVQMRFPDGLGGALALDAAAARLAGPRYRLGISWAEAREAIGRAHR